MKLNVGGIDRVVRIVLGLALIVVGSFVLGGTAALLLALWASSPC